jgi:hypothetical protein
LKKILFALLLLVAGVGIGGGAAFGVGKLLGPPPDPPEKGAHAPAEAIETEFIPAGTLLAPIVAEDGNLSGYANFEVQLEVPAGTGADITAKLPLLLHAVNLRAFATPMAAGPQHVLPDLRLFAKMVEEAAQESLGKGAIVRAVVMSVRPV